MRFFLEKHLAMLCMMHFWELGSIAGQHFNDFNRCWKIMWYSESVRECLWIKILAYWCVFTWTTLILTWKLHACVITYLDIWPTAKDEVQPFLQYFRWPLTNHQFVADYSCAWNVTFISPESKSAVVKLTIFENFRTFYTSAIYRGEITEKGQMNTK